MKNKVIILISLFVFLVIFFAPAKIIKSHIPSGLILSGINGTIWSGSLDAAKLKKWEIRDIKYQLSFVSLLTGSLGGSAQIAKGDVPGELDFSLIDQSNFEVDDASVEVQAYNFEPFIPFPGVQLLGKATTQDLEVQLVKQRPVRIQGIASWEKASVKVKQRNYPLGDFSVIFSTEENGAISGKLDETQKNTLDLKGTITLSKGGLMEFKGSVAQSIDKNIYTALTLFADGGVKNGRLPIKFKKKLF